MKNKILIFISIVLSLTLCNLNKLNAENVEKEVKLTMYSNIINDSHICGIYSENTFYIPIEKAVELINGKLTVNEEKYKISFCSNLRNFYIDTSGTLEEKYYNKSITVKIPIIKKENSTYISMIHILKYAGATVLFNEAGDIQVAIEMPYTILDCMAEFDTLDRGGYFDWSEVATSNESLEDKLVNAGINTLIHQYDSNIFRMAFDTNGIEQDVLKDAILQCLSQESAAYSNDDKTSLNLINTESEILSSANNYFDILLELNNAISEKDSLCVKYSDLIKKYKILNNIDIVNTVVNNVANSIKYLDTYESLNTLQKNLLSKTILRNTDNPIDYNEYKNLFSAAKKLNKNINSEYSKNEEVMNDVVKNNLYGLFNGAIQNPLDLAYTTALSLTENIPYFNNLIDKKANLYQAYNCSVIQYYANQLLCNDYSNYYYQNYFYNEQDGGANDLIQIKYDLILQLKTTLSTRTNLINSNYLDDDYKKEMQIICNKVAHLLECTEHSRTINFNLENILNDISSTDISWIAAIPDPMTVKVGRYVSDINYVDGDPLYSVYITDVTKDKMKFSIEYLGRNSSPIVESNDIEVSYDSKSTNEFNWEDSFGNSGTGIITFISNDKISISAKETQRAEFYSRASLASSKDIELTYKN